MCCKSHLHLNSQPSTPPESPAIFHYTLPSPGLDSPLSLFESLGSGDPARGAFLLAREPWVEQVDFRLPEDQCKLKAVPKAPKISLASLGTRYGKAGKPLPSLDQISARLHGRVPTVAEKDKENRCPSQRLPAFLRALSEQPDSPAAAATPLPKPRPSLSIGVGRLKMPVRGSAPQPVKPEQPKFAPPPSPRSPLMPQLRITTLVVPRTPTMSPTAFSETNLLAFNANREQASKDMMSALERRTTLCDLDLTENTEYNGDGDDRKSRRQSSPADLPKRERIGFEHPVLSMPGGF